MSRRVRQFLPLVLFAISAFLFLIADRAAYKGYFTADEINNMAFTRWGTTGDFVLDLLSPRFYANNYRPVGHFFFRTMGHAAGLNFPPYVAFLHIVHLANIALLWLILRRFLLPFWAAVAGALFFAFNMAVFDVYWKPMYVFDLLCGTFCLLSLLLWMNDRWLLSLVVMWLAYRSKEVAVMLPVALASWEFLLGRRRWLRLLPFFAISLWFGIQGVIAARNPAGYLFHYDLASFWKAVLFYSSRLVLLPYDGLVLLPFLLLLPLLCPPLVRDRTVWCGAIIFAALLTPMLLLSDRFFSAYLYVPLIGLSIAVAATAARQSLAVVAIAFALWIPWNYANLRWLRRDALSQAADRRAYVATLADLVHKQPGITNFLYRDGPLEDWGAQSAIAWLHPGVDIHLAHEGNPDERPILQAPALAVLHWNKVFHRLEPVIRTPSTPDLSYVEMGSYMPVWQLGPGWLPGEGLLRWTRPHATARLLRPAGATGFELVVAVSPLYNSKVPHSHVTLALNGRPVGSADFEHSGLQTVSWKIEKAPPGEAQLSFDTSPPYPGNDPLGIAVVSFGFLPKPPPATP